MQAARTTTAEHGSRTTVVTDAQPREAPHGGGASSSTRVAPQGGVLRLRGGPRSTQRVVWREDVIDNEGSGKKSSKSTLPPSLSSLPASLFLLIAHNALNRTLSISSLLHIPQTPRI